MRLLDAATDSSFLVGWDDVDSHDKEKQIAAASFDRSKHGTRSDGDKDYKAEFIMTSNIMTRPERTSDRMMFIPMEEQEAMFQNSQNDWDIPKRMEFSKVTGISQSNWDFPK